jgi:ankyrin repeat protein
MFIKARKKMDAIFWACQMTGDLARVRHVVAEDPTVVNRGDGHGQGPLHWAAWYGKLDIAKLLVANKADVDAKDNHGWTPLHLAARCGRLDVVKFLVSKGADVHAKNSRGATPLRFAAYEDYPEIVEYLWLQCDSNPTDEKIGWFHELNHAARMCLLFAQFGLSSDMITMPSDDM